MANTLKFGAGQWATKEGSTLAYNDENDNYKPLPFDFTRASNATVVNKAGLIETVGNAIPRIDFLGNTQGALKLEPQRTNLVTYSEDFSNWNTIQSSLTSDYGISPDGSTNSTRCVFSSSNQSLELTVSASNVIATIYIKGTIGETIQFGTNGAEEIFTLSGDWQRLEKYNSSSVSRVTLNTYAGVTARDVEIWGAQLEQGSYATSYIPTSGSSVTRLADVCTNGANEQVINSTEGVLYAEISALANDGTYRGLCLSNGSASNRVLIYLNNGSNQLRANMVAQGNLQANLIYTVSDVTILNKVAIKWSLNNVSFWINGSKVLQDLDAPLMPTGLNELSFDSNGLGGEKFYGNVKDLKVYNTALTDAELATLTTI